MRHTEPVPLFGKIAIAGGFAVHYLLVVLVWVEAVWSPLSISPTILAFLALYAFSAMSFIAGFGWGYISHHRRSTAWDKSRNTPYVEQASPA